MTEKEKVLHTVIEISKSKEFNECIQSNDFQSLSSREENGRQILKRLLNILKNE